jgi:GTPase SAR1 family protein
VILNPPKVQPKEVSAMYKIVMIGASGSGKTSLLLRFSENLFNQYQGCTVGLDFKIKMLKID